MDPKLLEILCCPQTRQPLRLASATEIGLVNQAIASGAAKDPSGAPVKVALEGLLIRQDGTRGYAIRKGIPNLLIPEGIALEGILEVVAGSA